MFNTQASVFYKILEHKGNIKFYFLTNRGAGIEIGKNECKEENKWTYCQQSKQG